MSLNVDDFRNATLAWNRRPLAADTEIPMISAVSPHRAFFQSLNLDSLSESGSQALDRLLQNSFFLPSA